MSTKKKYPMPVKFQNNFERLLELFAECNKKGYQGPCTKSDISDWLLHTFGLHIITNRVYHLNESSELLGWFYKIYDMEDSKHTNSLIQSDNQYSTKDETELSGIEKSLVIIETLILGS
jgi:hypothetical protein